MTDDCDKRPTLSEQGHTSPAKAVKFMIAQEFGDPQTLTHYLAYSTQMGEQSVDINVLDTQTEQISHYRVTVEEVPSDG